MGIIIKPLVTEKMTAITEKLNRFGFIVRPEANKLEIKSEIEALYNVTVVDVNTLKYSGKSKSRYTKSGIINGRTNAYKKAIVTLKEGDTIDFYSNNISLFTISIKQQSNTSRTIRIVFYSFNNCGYTVFVSLEINKSVFSLVTTAHIAHCHFTNVVATTC